MRRRIAPLFLATVLLGGCSTSTRGAITRDAPDPTLVGRFFAVAGATESRTDLYEVRFVPGHVRLYRLTTSQRIGGIGGCAESLTVTNADRSVGFTDTIQTFENGKFLRLPVIGEPKASSPAVADDCRIVFDRFDPKTNPPTDHLILFDPKQPPERELYSPGDNSKALGIADWGVGGQVAVIEGTTATEGHPSVPTAIVVIAADGTKRTIAPPVSQLGTLQWGRSGWMALSDEPNHKTVFLNPDSGARSELAGWFPLAWSPDGQKLLVTGAADRKTLGLVDAADLGQAKRIAHTTKVAIFDFVWLPENSAAGGAPPAAGRKPDDGD